MATKKFATFPFFLLPWRASHKNDLQKLVHFCVFGVPKQLALSQEFHFFFVNRNNRRIDDRTRLIDDTLLKVMDDTTHLPVPPTSNNINISTAVYYSISSVTTPPVVTNTPAHFEYNSDGGCRKSQFFNARPFYYASSSYYLKKNHNAPRPSEHPPVRGKKMSKRCWNSTFVTFSPIFATERQSGACYSSAEVVSSILVTIVCVFFSVAESVRTGVSKIQPLVDEL